MQTVGNFNQDHPDIFRHGKYQLAKIFSLCRSMFCKDASGNFSKTFNNLSYFRAKKILNILHRIIGILHHIVKKSRANRGGTHADFTGNNAGNC